MRRSIFRFFSTVRDGTRRLSRLLARLYRACLLLQFVTMHFLRGFFYRNVKVFMRYRFSLIVDVDAVISAVICLPSY